jgi:hypothetical protein
MARAVLQAAICGIAQASTREDPGPKNSCRSPLHFPLTVFGIGGTVGENVQKRKGQNRDHADGKEHVVAGTLLRLTIIATKVIPARATSTGYSGPRRSRAAGPSRALAVVLARFATRVRTRPVIAFDLRSGFNGASWPNAHMVVFFSISEASGFGIPLGGGHLLPDTLMRPAGRLCGGRARQRRRCLSLGRAASAQFGTAVGSEITYRSRKSLRNR